MKHILIAAFLLVAAAVEPPLAHAGMFSDPLGLNPANPFNQLKPWSPWYDNDQHQQHTKTQTVTAESPPLIVDKIFLTVLLLFIYVIFGIGGWLFFSSEWGVGVCAGLTAFGTVLTGGVLFAIWGGILL